MAGDNVNMATLVDMQQKGIWESINEYVVLNT
jgi:hypothetical protein